MKKKIAMIVIILLSFFLIILLLGRNTNHNVINKLNNNKNVIRDYKLDNLQISDVGVSIDKENVSTYSASITNTSDNLNKIEFIDIIFKDKNGKVLTTLIANVGEIEKNETVNVTSTTKVNLKNATNIEYKKSGS